MYEYDNLLRKLVSTIPEIRFVVVINREGEIISYVTNKKYHMDVELLQSFTVSSAIADLTLYKLINLIKLGKIEQLYTKTENGYLLSIHIDQNRSIIIITSKDVRLGLLILDVRKTAEQIRKIPYELSERETPLEEKLIKIEKDQVKTNTASNLISDFESKMREFIKSQLKSYYKEDWWNQGIPQKIRQVAEKRKTNKELIEPKRAYNTIDFLNFLDYNYIILYKKNWNNIFAKFFREKYVIQAPFEKLSNIRNDIAHNRFLDEDFERCKTYITDILKYMP